MKSLSSPKTSSTSANTFSLNKPDFVGRYPYETASAIEARRNFSFEGKLRSFDKLVDAGAGAGVWRFLRANFAFTWELEYLLFPLKFVFFDTL